MRTSILFVLAAIIPLCTVGCDKNASSSETTTTPPPARTDTAATKPDNTAANRGDHDAGAKTPVDQGESAADIKITADIRRAMMDDKDLSVDAKNAKVITKNAMVTLRGVVNTTAEKDSIEAKAKAAANVAGVDDQLTVKNP